MVSANFEGSSICPIETITSGGSFVQLDVFFKLGHNARAKDLSSVEAIASSKWNGFDFQKTDLFP